MAQGKDQPMSTVQGLSLIFWFFWLYAIITWPVQIADYVSLFTNYHKPY